MQPDKNVHLALPHDLAADMEALAAAEGKTPDELYQDAAKRFLAARKLGELAAYGQAQAKHLDYQERDVMRLIKESRQDQRERSAKS